MKKIGLIWLAAGAFLSSVGMSFIWPLTSVYLHNDLGISLINDLGLFCFSIHWQV